MVQLQVPIKVFLVDDSAPIRQRVAEMLSDQAMAVVGQGDTPQSSIDGILALQPDVVVLDIQLHGGTGLDVLRAVRVQAPQIQFIVLSNNAGPAYRKLYRMEGAARFLDKSADFDLLAQAIKTVSRSTAPCPIRSTPRRNHVDQCPPRSRTGHPYHACAPPQYAGRCACGAA